MYISTADRIPLKVQGIRGIGVDKDNRYPFCIVFEAREPQSKNDAILQRSIVIETYFLIVL